MKINLARANRLAALRIIAIYSLFATLWIFFSDTALGFLVQDKSIFVRIAIFKGLLFIIVTAALLYQLIVRYIQKTREFEKDLTASRNLINSLMEGTTDTIFVKDLQGRYLLFNSASANVVGKSAAEVIGHDDTSIFSPVEAGAIMAGDRRVMDAGRVMTYEDYLTAADGTKRTFLSTKGPVCNESGEVIGLFGISRDISERKHSEDALLESEAKFRALFERMTQGVFYQQADGTLVDANPAALRMFGVSREEFIGRRSADTHWKVIHEDGTYFPSAEHPSIVALKTGREVQDEVAGVFNPRSGGYQWIVINAIPQFRPGETSAYQVFVTMHDITERKHLEEQLRQSQKMEAIGQLAGGIAHDFNNILTAIYGYCSVLQMKVGMDEPFRQEIDHIYAAAERAANLTKSLLAFSRKQIMTPRSVNLNDIVMNVGKLLTRIIGEDIRLKTEFKANPLMILADSGQIEQVLMNLAANARDAMPDGGLLSIETEVAGLDEEVVHAHGYGAPGKYAVISVSDSGKGMDASTAKKIFEPFFTTKEVGKGTGLGLAIVYGVVKQHNGFLNVYSESGKGTTFRIYLPQSGAEVDDVEVINILDSAPVGSETILVAEDDTSIRELIESVLVKYGYDVIIADDGVDALDKFKANREKVDIIIMDMVMPKKSGREAYQEIIKLRSDVKVLFISGYSPDLLQNRGFLDTGEDVLIKPFQPLDLVRKVRSVLDTPPTMG